MLTTDCEPGRMLTPNSDPGPRCPLFHCVARSCSSPAQYVFFLFFFVLVSKSLKGKPSAAASLVYGAPSPSYATSTAPGAAAPSALGAHAAPSAFGAVASSALGA